MITDTKISTYIVGVDGNNRVYEGYDNSVEMPDDFWSESENKLTKKDCLELADIMIKRWQDFKEHWSNYNG